MSIHFNADEVFQMAEQIERNGSKFYRRAAERAGESQTAQLFLRLAEMEDEHEKIFVRMRSQLSDEERKALVPDPQDQSAAYLQAWADGHVFNVRANVEEFLKGKETIEDTFQLAIGLEKDSIVFYLGMKDAVPERLGRSRIDAIIREEMQHIASLSRQLQTLRHQLL